MFIDEVDSLCRARTSSEEEHTRRVKTELLRQVTTIYRAYNVVILIAIERHAQSEHAISRALHAICNS